MSQTIYIYKCALSNCGHVEKRAGIPHTVKCPICGKTMVRTGSEKED